MRMPNLQQSPRHHKQPPLRQRRAGHATCRGRDAFSSRERTSNIAGIAKQSL